MVRLLHLTDTHLVATEDDPAAPPRSFAGAVLRLQGRTTRQTLEAVLAAVAAAGVVPDVVLHTGDVVDDGRVEGCVVAHEMLAALGATVLAVPGNHDEAQMLAEVFGHDPVPVRWLDLDGWRIVAVDTSVAGQGHGGLTATGLEALDACLASAPGPVLIGLHHPPRSVCPDPYCQIDQAAELLAIVRRHPGVRAIVSGHLHVTADHEHEGVAFLMSPSTALQLRHVHPLAENNVAPTPVGARVVDLHDDGTVTTEVIWTSVSA
jgi:3',5'-cyclic-AMP phosphodiesterase